MQRHRYLLTTAKVGAGRTAKEQAIYDKGLVAVLASFHATLAALGRARQLEDERWMG